MREVVRWKYIVKGNLILYCHLLRSSSKLPFESKLSYFFPCLDQRDTNLLKHAQDRLCSTVSVHRSWSFEHVECWRPLGKNSVYLYLYHSKHIKFTNKNSIVYFQMPTGYETVNIHRAKFSGKTKLLLLPSSLHMFSLGICYECVPEIHETRST